MYERIFWRLRNLILLRQYVMTLHAEEEMDADALTVFDVESCILTGKIHQRQKDRNTGEYKYRIRGVSLDARKLEVVAKLGPTEKVVIITVYLV